MARGTTLGELVTMLRDEMSYSDHPAHSISELSAMKRKLSQTQERLYKEHAWPFLRGAFDVSTAAGQRYYDLPVDFDRVERVECKWNDVWRPLEYGIAGPQYNEQDSERDIRTDPPLAWYLHTESGSQVEQFELWPLPASNGLTIRFHGIRALPALISESDTAVLDDQLIVLFAASSMTNEDAAAKKKLFEANEQLKRLTKGNAPKRKCFVLGGGTTAHRYRPGPVRVAVDRGSN